MENEGLEALKVLRNNKLIVLGYSDNLSIIEKELKAKANLVSMCENLAKLVGLKEKDYVELETLITKKLKALEIIRTIGFHETEYIMCVSYNTYCESRANPIPKEDFDLVNEVLK